MFYTFRPKRSIKEAQRGFKTASCWLKFIRGARRARGIPRRDGQPGINPACISGLSVVRCTTQQKATEEVENGGLYERRSK